MAASDATWPNAVKSFTSKVDLQDINYAEDINEIQNEVEALETYLGANPYLNLPYATLNAALLDLFTNKAPTTHNHVHKSLTGDATGNDHPQYALLTGATFTGPVTAPPAQTGAQLATLGQLQAQGLADEAAVQAQINTQLQYRCSGASSGSVALIGNPTFFGWTLIGGYNEGCTDSNGHLTCLFGHTYSAVQTVTASKANLGLGSNTPSNSFFPCTPYTPNNAFMQLSGVTTSSATMTFTDKTTGSPLGNILCAFSWSALVV